MTGEYLGDWGWWGPPNWRQRRRMRAGLRRRSETATSEEAAYVECYAAADPTRSGNADTWRDSDGCWADRWHDGYSVHVSCDRRPCPGSELGLCAEHEDELRQRLKVADARGLPAR